MRLLYDALSCLTTSGAATNIGITFGAPLDEAQLGGWKKNNDETQSSTH
jgi:hypothetical protein